MKIVIQKLPKAVELPIGSIIEIEKEKYIIEAGKKIRSPADYRCCTQCALYQTDRHDICSNLICRAELRKDEQEIIIKKI